MNPFELKEGDKVLTIDGKKGTVDHKDMSHAPYIIYVSMRGAIRAYLAWQLTSRGK